MASQRRRRSKKEKQRTILTLITAAVVVVLVLIVGLSVYAKKYSPTKEKTDFESYYGIKEEDELFVVFDNEQMEYNAVLQDNEVYVNYETVHDYLNKRFYWDSEQQQLRYVTPEGLISASPGTAEYTLGKETQTADQVIAIVRDDQMYLSLGFIRNYTDIHAEIYENPGRVVISDQWDNVTYHSIKKKTQIREKGGVKSPILTELGKGDLVTVLDTAGSWSKVCSQDGFIGYVQTKTIGGEQEVLYDHNYTEPEYAHISRSSSINLAWHQVTNQSANANVAQVLANTKGINVLSPTWMYLNDNDGNIASLCSSDYVAYCHQQGIEVWALVSNLENSEVSSTEVLNRNSSRDNLVNNLVAEAIKYDLDGINVDFEDLSSEAADGYLEFIRELSVKCENNDLVLSVDNYVPASYNAYYDMEEQAVFADYIVLMAYDEHYNGSAEGSVASLSFVSQGVSDALEQVPAEQLVLGIPFYTRIWELTPVTQTEVSSAEGSDTQTEADGGDSTQTGTASDGSEYTVTSEAVGMSEVDTRVAANGVALEWLEDCGQYYAEYEYDGKTYKIWVENEQSIAKKLDVMSTNNLAGAAFWKLGYEKNTVWDTIAQYLP